MLRGGTTFKKTKMIQKEGCRDVSKIRGVLYALLYAMFEMRTIWDQNKSGIRTREEIFEENTTATDLRRKEMRR